MIWLLGEIAVSLLLAGIAGWYIGWAIRGFREGDRVEDLRRTLRATEEVKERELAEANRRADKAAERNERLQRENERLLERLESGAAMAPVERAPAFEAEEEQERDAPRRAAVATLTLPDGEDDTETVRHIEQEEDAPLALRLEERLAEAHAQAQDRERALRDKTAAVLALQAELSRLRESAEARATEMAKLEQRLVELEPLEERLGQEDDALTRTRAEVRQIEQERDEARRSVERLERQVAELQEEVGRRDVKINELRVRYQNTAAELEEMRAGDASGAPQGAAAQPDRASPSLEETRRLLQRQIERNRKQDAVHRQVVSSLQQQVADLRDRIRAEAAPQPPARHTEEARWQQLLAERDSRIMGLRGRVVEMERQREPERRDDLQRIYGIGPKLAARLDRLGVRSFAQIADWDDAEIERITAEIGDQTGRIRRDDWVRSARELMRGSD